MASNASRIFARTRLPQRGGKGDENAVSRNARQSSVKDTVANGVKMVRPALGEIAGAVNRKSSKSKAAPTKEPGSLKRVRPSSTSSTLSQRAIPIAPARAQAAPPVSRNVHARAPLVHQPPRVVVNAQCVQHMPDPEPLEVVFETDDMIIEEPAQPELFLDGQFNDSGIVNEREVLDMVAMDESEDDEPAPKRQRVWPEMPTEVATRQQREVQVIREVFEDDNDNADPAMVSEYCDEIFEYMSQLETEILPARNYMDSQHEIDANMRQVLVDWLLQVHLRYHMLPETLWIAINIIDRFLSLRVVSCVKLQLVGVAAMFIASKYEEILAPSVDEFVFMCEKGYSREEILKGERIILQTLDFKISHYCSPYSWMRKMSRADNYDLRTRTLGKFLTEAMLMDHRFIAVKPSLAAAVGMYCARRMLGGDWSPAFVYHSGYTEEQLVPGCTLLLEKLVEPGFSRLYVCKKYANRKFLKASLFATQWAHTYFTKGPAEVEMADC